MVTSDEQGLASLDYTPQNRGVKTVDAVFDGGDVARERVSFTIRAHVAGGGAGGPKGTGFEGQDQFLDDGMTSGVFIDADVDSGDLVITFNNTGTENRTLFSVRWVAYLRRGSLPVDTLTFEGIEYPVGEAFEPVSTNHTLSPGETKVLSVTKLESGPETLGVKSSDVVFLSVRYETPAGDVKISTYVQGG